MSSLRNFTFPAYSQTARLVFNETGLFLYDFLYKKSLVSHFPYLEGGDYFV